MCSSIFRTVPQEPRATRSPKPHLRNQERTFHVSSLPRKTTARRSKRRRLLLGSKPSRRPQRDAPALGLAPVNRPRPRARRRLAPRERRTTRGELATYRRSFPTTPYGAAAERARVTERVARVYQQRQAASAAVSLRRIASLVPTRPAALSSASACSSVLQLRLRATARATLDCTAHRCGPCRVRWSSFSLS